MLPHGDFLQLVDFVRQRTFAVYPHNEPLALQIALFRGVFFTRGFLSGM